MRNPTGSPSRSWVGNAWTPNNDLSGRAPLLSLLDQVFRGDFALGTQSSLRALFPWHLAGEADLKPTSFKTADMARLRSLSDQSTLVSNSDAPAASRIRL